MIRGLRDQYSEAIINIKLGDTDEDSYNYEQMVALLDWWEIINKDKQSKHCHDQWIFFSVCPFCRWHAREGTPGLTFAQLSRIMAAKMEKFI